MKFKTLCRLSKRYNDIIGQLSSMGNTNKGMIQHLTCLEQGARKEIRHRRKVDRQNRKGR